MTRQVLAPLMKGVRITLFVTVAGFAAASLLGLPSAAPGLSRNIILRQVARFHVEIIRGVPILVLLLYVIECRGADLPGDDGGPVDPAPAVRKRLRERGKM